MWWRGYTTVQLKLGTIFSTDVYNEILHKLGHNLDDYDFSEFHPNYHN